MYKTGDKPGEGEYRCLKCGKVVTIKADEALPECPKCRHLEWEKI